MNKIPHICARKSIFASKKKKKKIRLFENCKKRSQKKERKNFNDKIAQTF